MRRALELAEGGWGRVHPNPLVGAVVARDGRIIAEGHHQEFGGPHAEVLALERAGEHARGATLYVTLEPCSHHGKTPPCTDAVLASGVSRVVVAAPDPGDRSSGGADRLRAAGIRVDVGVEEELARAQNAIFFHDAAGGGCFVALKYALSLDGRLGTARNVETPVSSPESRQEVHRLRAGYDAILVGAATARVDDPLLTVRGPVTPRRPPVRIVADSTASLSRESRLVQTVEEAPVWLFATEPAPVQRRRALQAAGVRVFTVPGKAPAPGQGSGGAPAPTADDTDTARRPRVDLEELLGILRGEGIHSVFCEGGGVLGSALLRADLVERLFLFFAPRLFGEEGPPGFVGEFPDFGREPWVLRESRRSGGDALLMLDRCR